MPRHLFETFEDLALRGITFEPRGTPHEPWYAMVRCNSNCICKKTSQYTEITPGIIVSTPRCFRFPHSSIYIRNTIFRVFRSTIHIPLEPCWMLPDFITALPYGFTRSRAAMYPYLQSPLGFRLILVFRPYIYRTDTPYAYHGSLISTVLDGTGRVARVAPSYIYVVLQRGTRHLL